MRILITGSRKWTDRQAVWETLDQHVSRRIALGSRTVTIVHGACPKGADRHAADWCRVRQAEAQYGLTVVEERHPAEWIVDGRYNRAAGFKRNAEMVKLGADICLAFIVNESPGATHTTNLAINAGIPTRRYIA